jgi:hypothetical protein
MSLIQTIRLPPREGAPNSLGTSDLKRLLEKPFGSENINVLILDSPPFPSDDVIFMSLCIIVIV